MLRRCLEIVPRQVFLFLKNNFTIAFSNGKKLNDFLFKNSEQSLVH